MARLHLNAVAPSPENDVTAVYPPGDQLPELNSPASFPVILRTASLITLRVNPTGVLFQPSIGYKIQDTIQAPKDSNGSPVIVQSAIDAILNVLEGVADPDTAPTEFARLWLSQFSVEGKKLGADGAADFIATSRYLLGGTATEMFVEAALSEGRTRPVLTPEGKLIGNEDDDFNLRDQVWEVFEFIRRLRSWLSMPLIEALSALAAWVDPINPAAGVQSESTGSNPVDPITGARTAPRPAIPTTGPTAVFLELWANRVEVPAGFVWPTYTPEGIFWWRTIILPAYILHMFPLADTSDFVTVSLVRFAHMFNLFDPDPKKRDTRIPDWVVSNIKLGLTRFKYWLDEEGSQLTDWQPTDGARKGTESLVTKPQAEMTFWSENHQIQFATSEYLVGALFADGELFPYNPTAPKTAKQRTDRGRQRVRDWLDRRLRFGFSEWNSPSYASYDLPSLLTLVDFAPDLSIQTMAAQVLDTLFFDLARLTCRGSFGVSAGRAYWEQKCYGWEQGLGDVIEAVFASRGDYISVSDQSAITLATSSYVIPDAFLAMGVDRRLLDRGAPPVDKSRVSMLRQEAAANGVDVSKDPNNVVFWWGNMNYFGSETLDVTDQYANSNPNLDLTNPFAILHFFRINDGEGYQILYDTIETAAGVVVSAAGQSIATSALALPFPFDLIALVQAPALIAGAGMFLEGIVHLLGDICGLISQGVHAVEKFLGLAQDSPPKIPDSAIVAAFHQMLFAFTDGNVLQRANLYHYSNGDASLSSVQNHLPGLMAFQKHPWQATLGTDACVWTTAPFRSIGVGSRVRAWLDFIGAMLTTRTGAAFEAAALSFLNVEDLFSHDGFTYWNGSMALPLVVQYRSAAIIAYQFNELEKRLSDSATHAWFPSAMFDEIPPLVEANGGTWVFGRKDNVRDPGTGAAPNSGYVALYSARKLAWQADPKSPWVGKELVADGSSNVFVCVVGNRDRFGTFEEFQRQMTTAYLTVSGVGGTQGLECSFDIPGEKSPSGTSPRLELFYDQAKGRFAGQDLELDAFPRWDNQYASVPWGARQYTFTHPGTGLSVTHDLDRQTRSFTEQPEPISQPAPLPKRLSGNSLTPLRRFPTPPPVQPVGARLRQKLFQRKNQ